MKAYLACVFIPENRRWGISCYFTPKWHSATHAYNFVWGCHEESGLCWNIEWMTISVWGSQTYTKGRGGDLKPHHCINLYAWNISPRRKYIIVSASNIVLDSKCFWFILNKMKKVTILTYCYLMCHFMLNNVKKFIILTYYYLITIVTFMKFSNSKQVSYFLTFDINYILLTGLILGLHSANETSLKSNTISRWLGANLESSLTNMRSLLTVYSKSC